mmetsp:Transcript_953/g.3013  ORF Transcript_953/g.3013 Transcript_953/m.3013 type:complete len:291 (+) Transcript_953:1161-2033(+)
MRPLERLNRFVLCSIVLEASFLLSCSNVPYYDRIFFFLVACTVSPSDCDEVGLAGREVYQLHIVVHETSSCFEVLASPKTKTRAMEGNDVGAMWGPLMPCVCPFLARKHKPVRFFDIDGVVPINLRFVGVTDNVLISCLWIEQPLAEISSLLVLWWLRRLILVGDIHDAMELREPAHTKHMVLVKLVPVSLLNRHDGRLFVHKLNESKSFAHSLLVIHGHVKPVVIAILYDRSDLGVKLQQDTSKLLHLLWRHNREVIHHNYVVHRKVKLLGERNVVIVILVTIVSSHVP